MVETDGAAVTVAHAAIGREDASWTVHSRSQDRKDESSRVGAGGRRRNIGIGCSHLSGLLLLLLSLGQHGDGDRATTTCVRGVRHAQFSAAHASRWQVGRVRSSSKFKCVLLLVVSTAVQWEAEGKREARKQPPPRRRGWRKFERERHRESVTVSSRSCWEQRGGLEEGGRAASPCASARRADHRSSVTSDITRSESDAEPHCHCDWTTAASDVPSDLHCEC